MQGRIGIPRRRRHPLDQDVEQLGYAFTGLGRDAQDLVGRNPEDTFDLFGPLVRFGRGQVDLVERRHDREIVFEREVAVGQGLGLDALRRVDEQEGAFTRGEAS